MNDRQLFELIVKLLQENQCLLREIRDQLVPAPYYSTVGGSITVRS